MTFLGYKLTPKKVLGVNWPDQWPLMNAATIGPGSGMQLRCGVGNQTCTANMVVPRTELFMPLT